MFGFLLFLSVVSLLLFLVGLIKPGWVLCGEARTRARAATAYGFLTGGLFLAFLVTLPRDEANAWVDLALSVIAAYLFITGLGGILGKEVKPGQPSPAKGKAHRKEQGA